MQNKVEKIFEFMRVLDKVCLVKRATLLSDGMVETDSSHTFKLALAHDIAEAETGDYPKAMQRAHPEIKAKKNAAEKMAIVEALENATINMALTNMKKIGVSI